MGALGLTVATTSADAATVKVQAGDTLWGYSMQYKVPVAEIMQANHLTDPNMLQVGQTLEIPEGDMKKGEAKMAMPNAQAKAEKQSMITPQSNQPMQAGMASAQPVSYQAQGNGGATPMTTGQNSWSGVRTTALTNGQSGYRMTTTNAQANQASAAPQASYGGGQTQSAPAATGDSATAVARAQSAIGTPYVYGGNTPAGFDCSGLIQWAYGLGPEYRTTYQQTNLGVHQYDVYNAPAGALVFFGSDQAPYHAGISVGNSSYIQAPVPGQTVKTTHMSHYTPNYYINMN